METIRLKERVALVTGGSRGIGAAIATRLAAEGATVAINYRSDAERAEKLRASLGQKATAWQANVAETDEAERLVCDVASHHNRLDVLVANAGIWRGGRIDQIDPSDWYAVVATSLMGAFNVSRSAVPIMRQTAFGRIVVVSSVIGLIGFSGDTAYAAAKAGLLGFTKALAKETGSDGITVNAVAPGFITTDMTAALSDASRDQLLRRTSIRRPGRPEDVAAAVSFLVSDADYITGQTIVVDGGLSL